MAGTCKVCGGLISASNEVLGYGGPMCNGMHAQVIGLVAPTPLGSLSTANPHIDPTQKITATVRDKAKLTSLRGDSV